MNYEKIYKSLISKRKAEILPETHYGEIHHILPRCMGGNNDPENLVKLTPEEHLVAHLLLMKIHPSVSGVVYAANMMCNRVKNNKEYGWVKRKHAEEMSNKFLGIPRTTESVEKQKATVKEKYDNGYQSPSLGRTLTKDHKQAISEANTGREVPVKERSSLEGYIMRYGKDEGTKRYYEKNKKLDSSSLSYFIGKFGEELGKEEYEKYRKWSSEIKSGENNPFYDKQHTEESKLKISIARTGKTVIRTKEHNSKIGDAHRGKTHEVVTCPHCGKTGGKSTMKQWHFDRCKHSPDWEKNRIQRKIEVITCEHCGKQGSGPRMKSDHGENCKQKKP